MLDAAELAGVAQLGQSVRLIIERSRARIPPPAHSNHGIETYPHNASVNLHYK